MLALLLLMLEILHHLTQIYVLYHHNSYGFGMQGLYKVLQDFDHSEVWRGTVFTFGFNELGQLPRTPNPGGLDTYLEAPMKSGFWGSILQSLIRKQAITKRKLHRSLQRTMDFSGPPKAQQTLDPLLPTLSILEFLAIFGHFGGPGRSQKPQ